MQAEKSVSLPKELRVLASIAHLLERLERSTQRVDAAQYRSLVRVLQMELERVQDHPALPLVLAAFASAAQVYENMRYAQAGLCLHPIDESLATETAAADILRRAARRDPQLPRT